MPSKEAREKLCKRLKEAGVGIAKTIENSQTDKDQCLRKNKDPFCTFSGLIISKRPGKGAVPTSKFSFGAEKSNKKGLKGPTTGTFEMWTTKKQAPIGQTALPSKGQRPLCARGGVGPTGNVDGGITNTI